MSEAPPASSVEKGIDELEQAFPERVTAEPDGVGGAYVSVSGLALGDGWTKPATTLTFHLPYNYPAAAPYPYYLAGDTEPLGELPPALQRVQWRDQPAIQISLRNTSWDPERDSALGCVLQVADWLRHV